MIRLMNLTSWLIGLAVSLMILFTLYVQCEPECKAVWDRLWLWWENLPRPQTPVRVSPHIIRQINDL